MDRTGTGNWERVTQDSYTNVVGKSISRDGITITLNEIVMDSKNLWIAYSDSEDLNDKNPPERTNEKDLTSQDTDSDIREYNRTKSYLQVRINGQEIHQVWGKRTVNNNLFVRKSNNSRRLYNWRRNQHRGNCKHRVQSMVDRNVWCRNMGKHPENTGQYTTLYI